MIKIGLDNIQNRLLKFEKIMNKYKIKKKKKSITSWEEQGQGCSKDRKISSIGASLNLRGMANKN